LPPFWQEQAQKQEDGKMFYVNTLTNFMTVNKPEPFRGGILADEMGLGKTLTLISLIATNKHGALTSGIVQCGKQSSSRRPAKKKKPDLEALTLDPKRASSTLIVCPLSVMSIWVSQLEDHTIPGSLKVYLYHGSDRTTKASELCSHDIVLTTYNTLASEGNTDTSPVQRVKWLRVVLDEAHLIKNPNARMTQAVVSLQAERRWAVTGTPIQNGVKDLLSLMMFLKLQPLDEKSFWNRTIQRPVLSGDASGFLRLQVLNL
jgi:SWI/SNF-related matrix-associated actin-dependent regulator of chromatin subfamily A3